tara:strand:+ start:70 stop:183 length:114 start_codon:yes stop_codon:yes gene_type:complete
MVAQAVMQELTVITDQDGPEALREAVMVVLADKTIPE